MKTTLAIVVCLLSSATLYAAKPAGTALSAVCSPGTDGDSCIVTANGLVAGKAYRLDVRSNCADVNSVPFTAVAGSNNISITALESDTAVCTTSTFFFYLYLGSKQVAT